MYATLSARCAIVLSVVTAFGLGLIGPAAAQPPAASDAERIDQLESTIRDLSEQIRALQTRRQQTAEDLDAAGVDPEAWFNRFHLGGYGEIHANFAENGGKDAIDIHRLVLYLGYDFADWIRFHSEVEVEHAWASSDSDGYLLIEQAYVDFLLSPQVNVRAGRILTPLGIINSRHEPPRFFGVERPSFAKHIIPTTWSSDGVGLFGTLSPQLNYQLYVVGGLDGSGFDAGGIRDGRIKESPSLHEPAVTGRVDLFPFAGRDLPHNQSLRLGLSGYHGGLDNGNKGSNPGVDGDISIVSADAEYTLGRFEFQGATAWEHIDGARAIGSGTAEGIFGFYVVGGYHFWPDAWKTGRLANADSVAFVRYDLFDTQHNMPSGIAADETLDRSEWTFGVNFYPVPNLVVKADYQVRRDSAGSDLDQLINLGIGWEF
ncbi:MAG: hypothetical protein GX591_06395 [Planctomycetes bacterium]|nr:hypothetical protein [Planctomycetota bacterium]